MTRVWGKLLVNYLIADQLENSRMLIGWDEGVFIAHMRYGLDLQLYNV